MGQDELHRLVIGGCSIIRGQGGNRKEKIPTDRVFRRKEKEIPFPKGGRGQRSGSTRMNDVHMKAGPRLNDPRGPGSHAGAFSWLFPAEKPGAYPFPRMPSGSIRREGSPPSSEWSKIASATLKSGEMRRR